MEGVGVGGLGGGGSTVMLLSTKRSDLCMRATLSSTVCLSVIVMGNCFLLFE